MSKGDAHGPLPLKSTRVSPSAAKLAATQGLPRRGFPRPKQSAHYGNWPGRNVETPEAITDALFPDRQKQREADARAQRQEKSQLIAQGPNIVRDAYVAGGITGAPNASLSFSELKEAAAMEQYGETMGWSTRE